MPSHDLHNQWYVSNYQDLQINNNIKKMEKTSQLLRKTKKSGIQVANNFDNSMEKSK